MKTLKDYLEETIRRYGATGSSSGMSYTLEQGVAETISPASQARNAAARDYETDLLNKDNEWKQTWLQKTPPPPGWLYKEDADSNDPLLAKAIDLAPVSALEESAELRLILQRAKLIE